MIIPSTTGTSCHHRGIRIRTHLPAGRISSKVAEGGCKPSVNVVESKLLVRRFQDCLQMCSHFITAD